jgi:hypothetical protein
MISAKSYEDHLNQADRTFCESPETVRAMLIPYANMVCIFSFTLSVRIEAPQFREKFANRVVRWNKAIGFRHSYK